MACASVGHSHRVGLMTRPFILDDLSYWPGCGRSATRVSVESVDTRVLSGEFEYTDNKGVRLR